MVPVRDAGGLDKGDTGDMEAYIHSRYTLVIFWRESQLNLLVGCREKEKGRSRGRFPGF